jgi:putative ABC transport system ATP-binding protein
MFQPTPATEAAAVSETIASLDSLTKVYGIEDSAVAVTALKGVSIDFRAGESVAILGPSGSGKSTLMNILGCLDRPTGGRYVLGGVDVSMLDDDALSDIRGRRVGFVFQNFNLIHQLTVLENLEVPLFYQSVPAAERRRRALEAIAMVGLADRSHHRPMQLSGGQQQRAAIARALVNDPLIILADEPTGNLDTATGEMILAIFDRLQREGRTIIMVTHEADVARTCDRNITLRDGQIASDERIARS